MTPADHDFCVTCWHSLEFLGASACKTCGVPFGFDMPADDFFQAFRLHDQGELFYSRTFPNQQRDDIVLIELIASKGYSDAQKQAAMEAIVAELADVEIKPDNVIVVINEVGQGATWFAPERSSV